MIRVVTLLPYKGMGQSKQFWLAKHLGNEIRRPKVLLCYDYQNGITNEKEDIIFAREPELFSIGIINLPATIQSMKTIDVGIMDTDVKTSISK